MTKAGIFKTLGAVGGTAAAVWGTIELVYLFTGFYHNFEQLEIKVKNLGVEVENVKQEDKLKDKKIESLQLKLDDKKTLSYQVGKRTVIYIDPETRIESKIKKYRDWNGVMYEIFKDIDLSAEFGMDYYYYIHPITGNKVYVY